MRWVTGIVIALIVAIVLYVGSAVVSLAALVEAVRSGDEGAIISHIDMGRLRSSLASQIVGAYLDRIGQSRAMRPFERAMASTYGGSVVDAMLAKLLTPQKLAAFLQRGDAAEAWQVAAGGRLPTLGSLDPARISELLDRIRPASLMELEVRVSQTTEAAQFAAIRLRFELTQWKVTDIRLPAAIVRQLAATLPAS